MKNILLLLSVALLVVSCTSQTRFSEKALQETFLTEKNEKINLKAVLDKYKGKKVVIDVWASWCRDCINGMPKVEALQKEFPNAVYLFLSVDKTTEEWKMGIKKYNIKGEHYFMNAGTEGDLGSFLNIDWIPRYLVVDESGSIVVFKEVHADAAAIREALK